MISKNIPFKLEPIGKDYLWGGNRLNDDFSKNINMSPLAETWECSIHKDGESTVNGIKLSDILERNPEYLGKNNKTLPIIVKLIDANKDLSVQVHPTDEYASKFYELGKDEMWYVLDADSNAKIVYGLNHTLSKEQVKMYIDDNSFEQYLQKIAVKKNDVFYIKAGTIHAIGAGTLIVEIQESSNLTYRLFDYNRLDKNGKKRLLMIDQALEVSNLKAENKPKQVLRVLKYKKGCASEQLCRCKYFQVSRLIINTECNRNMFSYKTGELTFEILLCIDGCGTMFFNDNTLNFFKGDCIFIPANSIEIKIHSNCQLLRINC